MPRFRALGLTRGLVMTQLRWRESAARARLREEEIDQELRNTGRLFVLEPVGGVGEGEELGVGAVAQTFVSHFGQEETVSLAPEDARWDADGFVREFGASAEERAVPIDHAGEGAGLRPRSAVLSEIVGGESARAAGAEKRSCADMKIEGGKDGFRQPGNLKEEHVPTAEQLTRTSAEEFAHH